MRLITELLALSLVAGCPSSTDSDQAQYPQQPQPQPEYTYQPPQQVQEPQVQTHRLGIAVQPMTGELRTYFGAPPDRGVLVARVMPGSAAERAGIRVGDVVTFVGNRMIDEPRDLRRTLADNLTPTVDIQVIRQGQVVALQANLAMPEQQPNQML